MKKTLMFPLLVAAFVFAGCASKDKANTLAPAPEYQQRTETYQVTDHKTKSVGQDVPEWVTRFINDGVSGVEAMPQYQGKYVFIGEDTGTNLNALRQWSSGFTVAQDMSRMVSSRVQARFAGAAAGSPDDAYGRYFENVVKSASDASYTGARKETDFWIKKTYYKNDGRTLDTNKFEYDYFVLVTIDKEVLQRQVNDVLNGVKTDTPPTKEQASAIDRVKQAFYEGF